MFNRNTLHELCCLLYGGNSCCELIVFIIIIGCLWRCGNWLVISHNGYYRS